MIPAEIQSERLILFRLSAEQLRVLVAGGGVTDFSVEPGWLEAAEDLGESVRCADESDWWLPFLILLRGESLVIGVCLHKGPPDGKGVVEIAYAIAPTWRCQGYAREAVAAFTRETFRVADVTSITAHTLPERQASSRVLEHCGYTRVADFHDLEVGPLWKWQFGGE
jgi:[ribosomal protein S5]-alanine N-acetyltransferase